MRKIRQLHLYIGCFFTPLIIYFALSGAWQIFRFNNIPKDQPPSISHRILHELSKPHTSSTAPGRDQKVSHSAFFDWMSLLTAVGLIATSLLGVVIAYRQSRRVLAISFLAGILVPLCLLYFL